MTPLFNFRRLATLNKNINFNIQILVPQERQLSRQLNHNLQASSDVTRLNYLGISIPRTKHVARAAILRALCSSSPQFANGKIYKMQIIYNPPIIIETRLRTRELTSCGRWLNSKDRNRHQSINTSILSPSINPSRVRETDTP